MSLLQLGKLVLHSGRESNYKIECDALTDSDLEAAAWMLSKIVPPFTVTAGVPRGGLRLADAMAKHTDKSPLAKPRLLVCDDVFTTGGSLRKFIDAYPDELLRHSAIAAVIFSRGRYMSWVTPLFIIGSGLWDL